MRNHLQSLLMAGFGVWIFAVWRLAGMPSPGFAGRIIPAAWLLAAILNGKRQRGRWFIPMALSFTAGAWVWMLYPGGWIITAALPVAGLIAWAISISDNSRLGTIRAVLPVLLLSLITAEINGDEVRFAEEASALSGISSDRFSEAHFRSGDISGNEGHHTPLFPLLIAPGLLAGDSGLRIIPVIIALLSILVLAKLAGPRIAVVAALLYPGFGIFGLAMTGWLAAGLFTIGILLPEGRKWSAVRFLIALILVALKMRYAGLAAGIFIAEYACTPGRKGKWITPLVWISAGALVLIVDRYLLNGAIFWSRYGNIEAVNLIWANIFHRPLDTISHAGWSLFDPEAGLLFRAPWVLAAISGLFIFSRKQPARFKRLFIPSILYWAFLIVWSGPSWHGLPAPVGRMFVPMLPFFACGLAAVWREKETRLLVILSIAVSALVIASPICRYNYADGTDSILALLGITSGFSMVRSYPVQLPAALFLAVSMLLVLRKAEKYRVFSYVIIFAAVFFASLNPGGYEAEDMTPDIVQGAQLYPYISDPVERYFWFNSRERMLELSEPGQSILLPGVEAGDTLSLQMSGRGGVLSIGTELTTVETTLMEIPSLYQSIGRTSRTLPDWPENRLMEMFSVPIEDYDIVNGTVRIVHHSGPPVYMDRIEILKGSDPQ